LADAPVNCHNVPAAEPGFTSSQTVSPNATIHAAYGPPVSAKTGTAFVAPGVRRRTALVAPRLFAAGAIHSPSLLKARIGRAIEGMANAWMTAPVDYEMRSRSLPPGLEES
jgi:hypothetical protein